MKKQLMLVAAGLLAASYMDAATVYFDNTGNWSSVSSWTWDDGEEGTSTDLSSQDIDGHTLFVAETDKTNIIFKEGDWKNKTGDLVVTDGAVYAPSSVDPIAHIVDGKYVSGTSGQFDDMFLVGEMTGWSASAKYKMQTTDGVTYTLNVPAMNNEGFKFFGGAWGTRELTGAGTSIGDGTYNLVSGSANMSLDIPADETKDVTFTLTKTSDDWSSASLKIAGVGEVVPSSYPTIFFMSDRFGFEENQKFKMATENGEVYTLNIPDAGSDIEFNFKVKIGDEVKWFSNGQQNIHNGTFTLTGPNTTNMTLHTGGNVDITVKPLDNYTKLEVTIEGQDHDADPYPPIYLVSAASNWTADEAYRFSTENGTDYTLTTKIGGDEQFYILGADAHNYKFSNGRRNLKDGEEYTLSTDITGDMTLISGGEHVTFSLVLGAQHKSATLTITGQEEVEHTFPRMYLIGKFNDWTPATALPMTVNEEGVYTITTNKLEKGSQFKFFGGDWETTPQFSMEEGLNLSNGEYTLGKTQNNMSLKYGGEVTFTLVPNADFTSATLTIAGQDEENDEPINPEDTKLYLVGEWTDWNTNHIEMTYADGKYTVTTEVEAGKKFKFNGGDWGIHEFSMNDGTELENGEYTVSPVSADMTLKYGGKVTFALVPNADFTKAQLTIAGQEGGGGDDPIEDPTETTLYATGAGEFTNGSWNPTEPDVFTFEDGKYTLTVKDLSMLKISTSKGNASDEDNWAGFNEGVLGCAYGDTPGVAVNLIAGYSENIVAPWKGDYTITVSGDLSTITLSTETPAPTGPTLIYLRGDMTDNFGVDADWAMEEVTEGQVWKFTCGEGQSILAGEAFKIADAEWSKYNFGGNGDAIAVGKVAEVYSNSSENIILTEDWNGVCWFNVDYEGRALVAFSNDKDFEPDWSSFGEEPEYPAEIYMIGTIENSDFDWNPAYGAKLVYEEALKMYIAEGIDICGPKGTNGFFSFCTYLASPNSGVMGWDELGTRYAAAEALTEDEGFLDGTLQTEDADAAFEVEPGIYAVMVSLEKMTVTLMWMGESTGISSISADADEAIYFNLQGVRVHNPESGLYIKVVNGESKKVLVK